MEKKQKINRALSFIMLICFAAAITLCAAGRIYSLISSDYSVVTNSSRLKPNWIIAGPFLGVSILGFIAGVAQISLSTQKIKKNSWSIGLLVIQICFLVASLISCLSLCFLEKISSFNTTERAQSLEQGIYKCLAPLISSALATCLAIADCSIYNLGVKKHKWEK